MVTVNTEEKGFNVVFTRPWQAAIMERFMNSDEEMNCRQAHEYLIADGYDISRASVIVFLQKVESEDWLRSYERPGRGGIQSVYSRVTDARGFWRRVGNLALTAVIAESGIPDLYETS